MLSMASMVYLPCSYPNPNAHTSNPSPSNCINFFAWIKLWYSMRNKILLGSNPSPIQISSRFFRARHVRPKLSNRVKTTQEFTGFGKCVGGEGIWTRRRRRTKSTERSSGLHDCWQRKRRRRGSCVAEGARLQCSTEVRSLKRHGHSEMYTSCRSQLLFVCCAGSVDWNPKTSRHAMCHCTRLNRWPSKSCNVVTWHSSL